MEFDIFLVDHSMYVSSFTTTTVSHYHTRSNHMHVCPQEKCEKGNRNSNDPKRLLLDAFELHEYNKRKTQNYPRNK